MKCRNGSWTDLVLISVSVVLLFASDFANGEASFAGRDARQRRSHHGVYDLTHTYEMEVMPVVDGGVPLEMGMESHDEGNGAR